MSPSYWDGKGSAQLSEIQRALRIWERYSDINKSEGRTREKKEPFSDPKAGIQSLEQQRFLESYQGSIPSCAEELQSCSQNIWGQQLTESK